MTVILRNKHTGREIRKCFITEVIQDDTHIELHHDRRIGTTVSTRLQADQYEIARLED